jgi:nucleoside-diphosphate-sugar epimerase
MRKRVLLTGATGFIGRNTLLPLLNNGYEIHALSSQAVPSRAQSHLFWHQANLLEAKQVSEIMTQVQPTHLLHLAWDTTPGQYVSSLENIRWIEASLHLFYEFVQAHGKRLVIAGTCAEYDWRYGYCKEEFTPLSPNTLYGASKHSLQLAVSAAARNAQLSAAWGRVFLLYGPYEYHSRLVASIVCSLLKGQPARCTHGNQIRDFSHVEDIAGALVALLDSDVEGPVNIASGKPVAVRDIALLIGQIVKKSDLIELGALQANASEAKLVAADIDRLIHEVGWTSRYDLNSGLEHTISWWSQQIKEVHDVAVH